MPTVHTVMMSDIERCPIRAMSADHYRDDGTCECTDVQAPESGGVGRYSAPPTLDVEDLPTAIVTLCRLSSACMEQARWFAGSGGWDAYRERPGPPRNMPRASQWAVRAEELLEWVFEYFDDSKDHKAANRLAWLLLQYQPDNQEVT